MSHFRYYLALLLTALPVVPGRSAVLEPSDGAFQDNFGWSLGYSNNIAVIGTPWDNISRSDQGSAYVFRSIETATGTHTQNFKLIASDAAASDELGFSVSVFGTSAIVGAAYDNGTRSDQGSVYLYRNLDTATGSTVTETAKLIASDPTASAYFGFASSLNGNTALIGASGATVDDNSNQGAAYLYRNLNTATGTATQNAKLVSSNGETYDSFGSSVSLDGTMGLVGAYNTSAGGNAYLFRDLDTATETISEDVVLQASNAYVNMGFGAIVALKGSTGLVSGAQEVYLFRDLDTATGTVTENARLAASDNKPDLDLFGTAIAFSGNTAIIGDAYHNMVVADMGAAYLYLNTDTASGTVTENVKIIRSNGEGNDYFGASVALEGDTFVIGAYFAGKSNGTYSGVAYTGSVKSLTTLDDGNKSVTIKGISFESRQDWVVGEHTSANSVTLSAGDSAMVTEAGKAVYVGRNAGSDANLLNIKGQLIANEVYIGSLEGNTGNMLRLENTATFTLEAIRLADGNILSLAGNYATFEEIALYLDETKLQIWTEGLWETVNGSNFAELIRWNYSTGYTDITAVPEPSTWVVIGIGGFILVFGRLCRRRSAVGRYF